MTHTLRDEDAATWAETPRMGRVERAIEAGWEPHPDDSAPAPHVELPHDWQLGIETAKHAHGDCDECERCDLCGFRMCGLLGPERAVTCGAHVECLPCSVDSTCRDCTRERDILRDNL